MAVICVIAFLPRPQRAAALYAPSARALGKQARLTKLWWGAGIHDEMVRDVHIGQAMSNSYRNILNNGETLGPLSRHALPCSPRKHLLKSRAGLEAQARMVHLDHFHQGEVGGGEEEGRE